MYYGERFNSMSHIAGAILAACGGVLLITLAARAQDAWKIISFSIYAAALLGLYLSSSLYHGVRGPAKAVLRKMDHCAIYVLIAGSYTPFALVSLRGPWGWSIFGAVWVLALLGIVQELVLARGTRAWSMALYVLMGWLALVVAGPLVDALGWAGFAWLAAGGLCYTIGIAFYAADRRLRHGHGIWHLFVLGGSVCHYLAILFHVA